jgi:hypothetical protein
MKQHDVKLLFGENCMKSLLVVEVLGKLMEQTRAEVQS